MTFVLSFDAGLGINIYATSVLHLRRAVEGGLFDGYAETLILLQRRADSGNWALPGGAMELDESLTGSVIREVKEETGYDIEVTGMVGTYTDPKHIIAYADGEVRRQFNICYTARITGGTLAISTESTDIRFADPAHLDDLPMHPTQRLRIQHYLNQRDHPYLG